MPLSEIRDRFRQGLLDFAWNQWAQMGVSGNISGIDRWAIDPEALVLFTVMAARRDPRLFDEMLDWLTVNRGLLTMQRLRNLSNRFPIDPHLVGAVAAWTGERVSSQWFKSSGKDSATDDLRSVFDPDVLNFIPEPDPIFKQYGYIRPRVVRSGKSTDPDVKLPANFSFQLRYLFGPGSRSEVMRILLTLTDGSLDAARIADESGFAKRNVNDTLVTLVESRVIKARWYRNERQFVVYRGKWAALLEIGPSADSMPAYMPWIYLLPACMEIMTWLDVEAESDHSEYLVSSGARNLLASLTNNLRMANIDIPSGRLGGLDSYLPFFEEVVDSLLAKMHV